MDWFLAGDHLILLEIEKAKIKTQRASSDVPEPVGSPAVLMVSG